MKHLRASGANMTDILYAAPLSLFSGKARAYMDWKNVDYVEELCTPDIQRDIVIPNVGRPVIPVVKTADGSVVQDTTRIIDHYEAALPGPPVYPDGPVQKLVALLLELFGDEWLVIPAMHYRWNYNEEWVYGEFGAVALPDGTREAQLAKGRETGARFKGFVPMLGITPQTIPAIEASYEALLADLDRHFGRHDYLLGSRPSIGDFGLIGPLYAHLYRDPASGEIMDRIAPNVSQWVQRMVFVKEPLSGDFLAGDAVPDGLLPILARMMAEQLPYLQQVAHKLAVWAEANPGADVPRAVGMADFTIEGVTGERIATPYSLWMLQRALDHYRGFSPRDKKAADALLGKIGGDIFANFDLPRRVVFENHAIHLAEQTPAA